MSGATQIINLNVTGITALGSAQLYVWFGASSSLESKAIANATVYTTQTRVDFCNFFLMVNDDMFYRTQF